MLSEPVIDLGQGLQVWKIYVSELREQDINARAMTPEMFNRLVTTIQSNERLESLPFCALTNRGIEVISGHHRSRAATSAGLEQIYGLVDTTGLNRDQISAKQLAHNAIEGVDDSGVIKQIYESIKDANARLEAFVSVPVDLPSVKTHDIDVQLDYKSVLILFLPAAKEQFEKIVAELDKKLPAVYVSDFERFEEFKKVATRVCVEYDIRSVGTALAKMCNITQKALGQEVEDDERVALRDLFKTAYIPKDAAERVRKFLEVAKKKKSVTGSDLWRAIDNLIAEKLGAK